MAPNIRILDINPGSDGDGRKWPKHTLTRNDAYFLERIATDKWIKDLPGGPAPGVIYRLNKLPNGYAGFEKTRPDGMHVDRYIYGHPNGQFRSMNEFYPHFKYLMDYGGAVGCPCKSCKPGSNKPRVSGVSARQSGNDSEASEQSRYFKQPSKQPQVSEGQRKFQVLGSKFGTSRDSDSDQPRPQKRKFVDLENTPDIYELMIEKLKAAGAEKVIDEPINERMSPDWRAGDSMSQTLLQEWRQMPQYVPRAGELVLLVRKLGPGESLMWDKSSQAFRRTEAASKKWLDQPKWEAGVVTQMPKEVIVDQDLVTDEAKEQNVTNSGFRVEPLSDPSRDPVSSTKQGVYVPLHGIRPFYLYQECLNGILEANWDRSITHAMAVMSSFCVIGRYKFKGVWPNATVFSRGVYIGSELIVVGDTVRLLPRKGEQPLDAVTDVMVVTAVRLRFVNLDLEEAEEESPIPSGLPYQTCLHISGRVYTQSPTRSFDGVGKVPIDPTSADLPAGLNADGPWYHYSDPRKISARIEVPYTRILSRHYGDTANKAWFATSNDMPSPVYFQAVNKRPVIVKEGDNEISRGLEAVVDARKYSMQNDKRIKSQEGKTWFWADTRIGQLGLHEVNGRFVGVRDILRSGGQMTKWRTALKALDGKKGGLEEYHAARKAEKAKIESAAPMSSSYGMVAGSMQAGREGTTEAETGADEDEDADAMEVDQEPPGNESSGATEEDSPPLKATPAKIETITLYDSEDEDELANNQVVGELMKNIRANDARPR